MATDCRIEARGDRCYGCEVCDWMVKLGLSPATRYRVRMAAKYWGRKDWTPRKRT